MVNTILIDGLPPQTAKAKFPEHSFSSTLPSPPALNWLHPLSLCPLMLLWAEMWVNVRVSPPVFCCHNCKRCTLMKLDEREVKPYCLLVTNFPSQFWAPSQFLRSALFNAVQACSSNMSELSPVIDLKSLKVSLVSHMARPSPRLSQKVIAFCHESFLLLDTLYDL